MKNSILLVILSLLIFSSCQRKDALTEFRDEVWVRKSFYFEPSTLRMINLKQNPDFNKMIKEIKEGTLLMVDKNPHTDSAVVSLKANIIKEGYEELMTLKNKNTEVELYALERKTPVILAIARTDTVYNIIEMQGMINIAKLPQVLETFSDNQFLNVISLTEQKKKNPHVESDTTNKQPQ